MRVMGVVFLTTIAAGVCEGQIRLPASQPATRSTRPGGAWYCWSDAGLARTVGYGADCIWLAGSGLVWQARLGEARRGRARRGEARLGAAWYGRRGAQN